MPESTFTPDARLAGPALLRLERSMISERLPRAFSYARLNKLDRVVIRSSRDRIGIVAAGKTYLDVREALDAPGLGTEQLRRHGIRIAKIGMIWPLDPEVITEFADGLDEVIVVEEKRPFLENAIKEILYGVPRAPLVLGKSDADGRELVSPVGELDADQVASALSRRLGDVHGIESAVAWKRRPLTSVLTAVVATAVVAPAPSGDLARLVSVVRAAEGSRLAELVALRAAELVAYQDPAYARDYASFVEEVRAAEEAAAPGSAALAEAVAIHLYKLMAYEDEYEVARLVLDETFNTSIRTEFGPDAAYQVKLHPPLLRAMGLKRKISFGAKARPMFRLLYALRRLRGSRLDVFGYHAIRRMERELIVQYRSEIEDLPPRLSPLTIETAAKVASLPDLIRGYEQIKVRNVDRYRKELARLREEFSATSWVGVTSG